MGKKKRRKPQGAAVAPETRAERKKTDVAAQAASTLTPWSRWATLVTLFLAFILQLPINAILHITSHPRGSWGVDLLWIQGIVFVVSLLVAMPAGQVLARMPRRLGFMETISLGALYVLVLTLLLPLAVVKGSNAASATYDATGLATTDVLALLASAYIFPPLDRVLTRPRQKVIDAKGTAKKKEKR